jgi:hypothetical protein
MSTQVGNAISRLDAAGKEGVNIFIRFTIYHLGVI